MGQEIPGIGPRILVVDNDEQIRDVVSMFVQEIGYTVTTACDGTEALKRLEEDQTVTILFSDINMPGMDGEQLAARARSVRPELRVILTSGARRPQTDVFFVPKPFRGVDLLKVLPPPK